MSETELAKSEISKEDIRRLTEMQKAAEKIAYHLKVSANEMQKLMDLENGTNPDLLTVDYLMVLHPNLTEEGAESLLEFANECTIRHKECYGDGSKIFPRWDRNQLPT